MLVNRGASDIRDSIEEYRKANQDVPRLLCSWRFLRRDEPTVPLNFATVFRNGAAWLERRWRNVGKRDGLLRCLHVWTPGSAFKLDVSPG